MPYPDSQFHFLPLTVTYDVSSLTHELGFQAHVGPMVVVDPEARVIELESLRVIDSSIMPSITTGNLNAPTIMLAEKLADHVRGRSTA